MVTNNTSSLDNRQYHHLTRYVYVIIIGQDSATDFNSMLKILTSAKNSNRSHDTILPNTVGQLRGVYLPFQELSCEICTNDLAIHEGSRSLILSIYSLSGQVRLLLHQLTFCAIQKISFILYLSMTCIIDIQTLKMRG